MSRLDYAPKLTEIEITDIQKGLGVFTPKPDKPVSFAALKETLKKAGYTLDAADITVSGILSKDENGWSIVVQPSGQRFALQGPNVEQVVTGADAGASIELTGDWKTIATDQSAYEAISPALKTGARERGYRQPSFGMFTNVSYRQPALEEVVDPPARDHAKPLAPIRVTSPGLTVYKGGAVTPRLYLIKQHLGNLEVTRQMVNVTISYTPSPRLQLELEAPFSRTAFDNGNSSGSGFGLGNITAWAKYRFFRTVKTYGDRQAAIRFGLETPTGKKTAPSLVNVPEFVRQQLTPINGGLAPHFDLAFSQAGGRWIFGGNAEVVFRSERDGFRMGHEQRLSTDIEYVLPKDEHKPGGELFLILETTFLHRGRGKVNGQDVDGSRSTEFYLAPGLQYAAHPRFVIEGSYQFPVVRNTGPVVLRTDRNMLLGVRYLF